MEKLQSLFIPGENVKWYNHCPSGLEVPKKLNIELSDNLPVLLLGCFCSVAYSCPTLCDPMDWSMPGFPVLHHLPEFAHTHVHRVSNAIQPSDVCRPLLLLPSIFPSIRVFSNESALPIRWPKYRSFSFSISPSNKYSELISFRMDWFDFLAVKGLSNTTVQKHQFFCAQLSLWSNSHIHSWLLEKPYLWLDKLWWQNNVSAFQYAV